MVRNPAEGYLTTCGRRLEYLCAARRPGSFSWRPRVCARLSRRRLHGQGQARDRNMTPRSAPSSRPATPHQMQPREERVAVQRFRSCEWGAILAHGDLNVKRDAELSGFLRFVALAVCPSTKTKAYFPQFRDAPASPPRCRPWRRSSAPFEAANGSAYRIQHDVGILFRKAQVAQIVQAVYLRKRQSKETSTHTI